VLLLSPKDSAPDPTTPVTAPLPRPFWGGLRLCTPADGDMATVVAGAEAAPPRRFWCE